MDDIIKYFPFLAGAGALVGFWGQIKNIFSSLYHIVVIEVNIKGNGAKMFSLYLNSEGKKFSNGQRSFETNYDFVKGEQGKKPIIFECVPDEPALFFLKHRPIIIKKIAKSEDYDNKFKISFFRYTFKTEKLLEEAYNHYFTLIGKNRFKIFNITGSGSKSVLKEEKNGFDFDRDDDRIAPPGLPIKYKLSDIGYGSDIEIGYNNYIFSEKTQFLFNEVKRWRDSKKWHIDRSIPWRRAALLFGLPGTGKSSCIRTICQTLDLPIYIFDLASMDNKELVQEWGKCQKNVPTAVVFEDLDSVYNKRKIIKSGPTFDCFLNCLSGIVTCEGIFTFITTNRIECIDNSLGVFKNNNSSRPGRIDMLIPINPLNRSEREKMIINILRDNIKDMKSLLDKTDGMTASQCSEFLSQIALKTFWSK